MELLQAVATCFEQICHHAQASDARLGRLCRWGSRHTCHICCVLRPAASSCEPCLSHVHATQGKIAARQAEAHKGEDTAIPSLS
jgi:hypothetical protein